jgi:hypothetical protein
MSPLIGRALARFEPGLALWPEAALETPVLAL